ncbi:hypothetical protein SDC9_58207 [bioreactor metagenome]|jgi:hypothetical protein|uniref:Uncharacterized protein n=1 Tax=bioreactor metagenome TaxID=1076179 RepID=A0A644X6Q5_9ZZZZ
MYYNDLYLININIKIYLDKIYYKVRNIDFNKSTPNNKAILLSKGYNIGRKNK